MFNGLIVRYTLLMHIFNIEFPGFVHFYETIFVLSFCFILENVVRN